MQARRIATQPSRWQCCASRRRHGAERCACAQRAAACPASPSEGTADLDHETRPISGPRRRARRLRARDAPAALTGSSIRVLAAWAADGQQLRLELRHGSLASPSSWTASGASQAPLAWRRSCQRTRRRSSLPKGQLRLGAWYHSQTPEHTRRLGDLRLECRADLYGGGLRCGLKPPAFVLPRSSDLCCCGLCGVARSYVGIYADVPVFTRPAHGSLEAGRRPPRTPTTSCSSDAGGVGEIALRPRLALLH